MKNLVFREQANSVNQRGGSNDAVCRVAVFPDSEHLTSCESKGG